MQALTMHCLKNYPRKVYGAGELIAQLCSEAIEAAVFLPLRSPSFL